MGHAAVSRLEGQDISSIKGWRVVTDAREPGAYPSQPGHVRLWQRNIRTFTVQQPATQAVEGG